MGGLEVEAPAAAAAAVLPDCGDLALVAVERMPMPMVVADARDPRRPIVLANAAFLTLTGYDASEVLGRNCRFLQGPDTSSEAVRQLGAGLARNETVDVELLNYRKDGTTFWNAVHLSPIYDRAGQLTYYFGSQWDVTERHSAQGLRAAELRLLREVDHRAMNALALVQGFIRLSGRDSVEAFAQAIERRVQVLARAHTLLSQTRWADVTLDQLLRHEVTALGDARVILDGPTVLVSVDRVQPFALLLNELTSNARRHGALARPGGRLEISWRAGTAPGVVDVVWREQGSPTERPAPGLGLRLVASIVRQQLQGRLTQTWGETGLVVEFSCRVAAARAS